jgi:conjugal transfer pilus assembly protein TraB
MASFHLNSLTRKSQIQMLSMVVLIVILVSFALVTLGFQDNHRKQSDKPQTDLTGIVDESFSEANAESAMSAQQVELDSLKKQMAQLTKKMDEKARQQEKQVADLSILLTQAIKENTKPDQLVQLASANTPTQTATDAQTPWKQAFSTASQMGASARVHSMQFHYGSRKQVNHDYLNPAHYVPSGTFVRAVVLGGADADASVNGQSKNNGVMLFKLLQPGTLPNGQHSHLQGCFVTASSYGDISSERAYVVLDKLSCAQKNQPIIDKTVTGWAFFGGKVGIKGQPLMRDNKVMQWAGISGMMSGIASAAQYSQSVQSISALGSATVVPSGNIAPYAAYGGASKAAEVLSNYYVKRAEQYHPVIQVGSGNMVTIVFKDGFYLEPDEALLQKRRQTIATRRAEALQDKTLQADNADLNFDVPTSVLSKIDKTYSTQTEGTYP